MKHFANSKLISFILALVLLTLTPIIALAQVDNIVINSPTSMIYISTNGNVSDRTFTTGYTLTTDESDHNVTTQIYLTNTAISDPILVGTKITSKHDLIKTSDVYHCTETAVCVAPAAPSVTEGLYSLHLVAGQPNVDLDDYDYNVIGQKLIAVDNTAPTADITLPADHTNLSTGVAITISGIATDPTISGPGIISGSAITGSGVTSVAVTITGPGGYSTNPAITGTTAWSTPWTTPAMPGEYTISAKATDAAGNVQAAADIATVYVGMSSYRLTLTASPAAGGTVSPTSSDYYASGTAVSISAVAASGYYFDGWTASAGTFSSSGALATTFTMPAQNVTVTANFKLNEPIPGDDTINAPAAPAIAKQLLKEHGVKPNSKNQKNFISQVAKQMKGTDFDNIPKENTTAYRDAIDEFLDEIGAY